MKEMKEQNIECNYCISKKVCKYKESYRETTLKFNKMVGKIDNDDIAYVEVKCKHYCSEPVRNYCIGFMDAPYLNGRNLLSPTLHSTTW